MPIGRRVAYWRERRRMSQQVFADRLGRSKSWVEKVERGVRRLDRFTVVNEIADVLQVDVQLLLGRAPHRTDSALVDQVEVEEIRSALERYESIGAFLAGGPEPAPVDQLRVAVGEAWRAFHCARYGELSRKLPRLLRDVQTLDAARPDTAAAHLLSQVYQLMSALLRKVGEHELCWVAADRSIAAAYRSGDRLLAGAGAYRVGAAMLALGRVRPALEVSIMVANRLVAGPEPEGPAQVAVQGMLLLNGALAAARLGDGVTARDLLGGAARTAAELGHDADLYGTWFGPVNVELHRVSAAVELGDGRMAVAIHERLDRQAFAAMPPERRAHHHLEVARAYLRIGDAGRAGEMLLLADLEAPAEVRARPVAHEVLSDILRRARGTLPAPITDLAETLDVSV
ncbi:helix-turn-helix domain-containing protein [Actinoplanes sp. NBRC 103695]|uniref:helix-turn-helix domain-containing protein n=1 Tax=Actinoplanes sp. NBRC 103695 TaxID=3032202 RepID=UPI00255263CB|nr:helix-turn-helix domain-containing protein [Actinoplanes sp. NBRC 103695]